MKGLSAAALAATLATGAVGAQLDSAMAFQQVHRPSVTMSAQDHGGRRGGGQHQQQNSPPRSNPQPRPAEQHFSPQRGPAPHYNPPRQFTQPRYNPPEHGNQQRPFVPRYNQNPPRQFIPPRYNPPEHGNQQRPFVPRYNQNPPRQFTPRHTQPGQINEPNHNNRLEQNPHRRNILPMHERRPGETPHYGNEHRGRGFRDNWYGGRRIYWDRDDRYGWDRDYWNSEWPLIVIIDIGYGPGINYGTGIGREALNLGPNFDNAYFVVSGYQSFGRCMMSVSLYDQYDNFMTNIFPGDISFPQQSQYGDMIVAAGLNSIYVQSQIANDLCNGGDPVFE